MGKTLDDLEGGLAVSPNEVLERLWHLFISMRFGLVLMLILALFTLAGTLLAQAPAGMRSDPQAYAAWLESIRPRYGGWTNVLETIGFLDIEDGKASASIWRAWPWCARANSSPCAPRRPKSATPRTGVGTS